MNGFLATEPLFNKATDFKKREGLWSPRWRFATFVPPCFSQNYFLKIYTSAESKPNFSKPEKTHLGNTVEKILRAIFLESPTFFSKSKELQFMCNVQLTPSRLFRSRI